MQYGVKFMSNDKSIISFAIMSIESNNNKDYIDMIIPFVLYILTDKKADIVSINDTKRRLLDEFGIKIPSNVLEALLKRLTTNNYGYLRREKNLFFYTEKQIEIGNFEEERSKAQQNQLRVLDELYTFLQQKEIVFEKSEIDKRLIEYLSKYGYTVIENDSVLSVDQKDIWNYRIGQFIEYVYNHNIYVYNYIKDIVKGAMLVSAIHMQENTRLREQMRFKDTQVYLDTPLLMHILGYSGEALKEACTELVKLLQDIGAEVCYFEHNEDEVKGILDAYILKYKRGRLEQSYNYEYLIENNITDIQATAYKMTVKSDLARLKIYCKEMPDYQDYNRNIDWIKFEEYISERISYKKDTRRKNDIESIAAVYRLRDRNNYKRIENCKAIFVATNSNLIYHINKYFKEIEKREDYPASIDDTLLTSIVWFKSTASSADLPSLRLIADALATQRPTRQFWEKFIDVVSKLEKDKQITDIEASELRLDALSKKHIYEVTEGDSSKINHASLAEALKLNDVRKHGEILNEKERLEKELDRQLKENNQKHIELMQEKLVSYEKGFKLWKGVYYLSKLWLFIVCILGVILGEVGKMLLGLNILQGYLTWIVCMLGVIILASIKLIDKLLNKRVDKVKIYLVKKSFEVFQITILKAEPKYGKELLEYAIKESKYFSDKDYIEDMYGVAKKRLLALN